MGVPRINISLKGKCNIGKCFVINNLEMTNPIGRFHRCCIIVRKNACLNIGENVGISSTTIYCQNKIEIGNHVKIGANVVIYDTDFHSLDFFNRRSGLTDMKDTKTAPVIIEDDVFIGAHTTILKGVTIGKNSIIGACAVVTKSIPPNQIWAGNPAKHIRNI
jgi:acetyltransferase-like isoleucine patch superfamily enzyme